ncbi:MAG: M6 family metalloprotease domain-containing protein [Candidatus Helarchaeota archaeon]
MNSKDELSSIRDNGPYISFVPGPNGELPAYTISRTSPPVNPSPTGNSPIFTDDFESYESETAFIDSSWYFFEGLNTHCDVKENRSIAYSGKRFVEFYDDNSSSYCHIRRALPTITDYLYLRMYVYAKQTNAALVIWLQGDGGYFYIAMGQNSNGWYIGSNSASIWTGDTYNADQWYTIEIFANILKNTYDFYVDNKCIASNVTFYSMGASNINFFQIWTSTIDLVNPNIYFVDDLEIAVPPKMICLLVEFSDMGNSHSKEEIYQTIFTNDQSMRNYYKENSYNKFTIAGTVTDWLMLPQTMVYYGAETHFYQYTIDALYTANPVVDYSVYDHVVIIHAGDDEAHSSDPNDIWSACYRPSSGYQVGPLDGIYINHICTASELEGVGCLCHEFGHMLDLPDLYDTTEPKDHYVDHWGLMASGSWNGPSNDGTSPAHMMAWCKIQLGWLSSQNIEVFENTYSINGVYLDPSELPSSKEQIIKFEIDVNHYYLVESRLRLGFDSYLPDEGIIVTYIDETLGSGQGIVRIQDSRPSTASMDDGEYTVSSGSEYAVFRDISRKIYLTIGSKTGNVYFLYGDRYTGSSNRTYDLKNVAAFTTLYYNLSMTAGEIIVWDWWSNGFSDFRILRPSDSAEWESISNIGHDGGIFRAPTTDLYQFRISNAFFIPMTVTIELLWYFPPALDIYDFINLDSPIYRTNEFTIRLRVRNTAGSLVEGVKATLNLPPELTLLDPYESSVNIEDLGYNEYATVYWELYAGTLGSTSIQVVLSSTWGGAPTQNLSINILLDTTPPSLTIQNPPNNTIRNTNSITISWIASDSQTDVKIISIYLNEAFICNTSSNFYNLVGLSEGLHYCKIVAYNWENLSTTKLVTFRVDTKKPSKVIITSLVHDQWYRGIIPIVADVWDNGSGVNKVEFYIGNPTTGGFLIGTDSNGANGWALDWHTSISDEGTQELYIRAYDLAENYNDSGGISIRIDNSPPINLFCPSIDPETTYSGNISIEIIGEDFLSGIRNVEFWLGSPSLGTLLCNDSNPLDGWGYTWVTTAANDGSQTIVIRVYDVCGNMNSFLLSIKVKNAKVSSLSVLMIVIGIVGAVIITTTIVIKKARRQKPALKFTPTAEKDFKIVISKDPTSTSPSSIAQEPAPKISKPKLPKTSTIAPTPPKPTTTLPSKPTTTLPSKPTTTLPSKPTTTLPSKPTTTLPSKPTTTLPSKPTTTLPFKPNTSPFAFILPKTTTSAPPHPSPQTNHQQNKKPIISQEQTVDLPSRNEDNSKKSFNEEINSILKVLESDHAEKQDILEIRPYSSSPAVTPSSITLSICPHCRQPLPEQKSVNLKKGISILCPVCLKIISPNSPRND